MPKVQLTINERFFYKNGASCHSIDETFKSGAVRAGILLAEAEKTANDNGWYAIWDIDRDADTTPTDVYFVSGNPQWEVTLYRDNGDVIGSLCGVDFGTDYSGGTPEKEPYARVVFA
jgi:hypothetical protein